MPSNAAFRAPPVEAPFAVAEIQLIAAVPIVAIIMWMLWSSWRGERMWRFEER